MCGLVGLEKAQKHLFRLSPSSGSFCLCGMWLACAPTFLRCTVTVFFSPTPPLSNRFRFWRAASKDLSPSSPPSPRRRCVCVCKLLLTAPAAVPRAMSDSPSHHLARPSASYRKHFPGASGGPSEAWLAVSLPPSKNGRPQPAAQERRGSERGSGGEWREFERRRSSRPPSRPPRVAPCSPPATQTSRLGPGSLYTRVQRARERGEAAARAAFANVEPARTASAALHRLAGGPPRSS